MSDLVSRVGIGVVLLVMAAAFCRCAAAPSKPPVAEVQCGSSNFEKCADKCASQGRGAPFIVENATDVACYCKKNPEDT